MSGLSLGGSRIKGHGNRKRKKRVVNLRKSENTGEMETVVEDGSTITDSTSVTGSTSDVPTVFSAPPATSHLDHMAHDPVTPPQSPRALRALGKPVDFYDAQEDLTPHARVRQQPPTHIDLPTTQAYRPDLSSPTYTRHSFQDRYQDRTIRPRQRRVVNLNRTQTTTDDDETPRASMYLPEQRPQQHRSSTVSQDNIPTNEQKAQMSLQISEKQPLSDLSQESIPSSSTSAQPPVIPNFLSFITEPSNSSSIAERAWMMKMAAEVARRYDDERKKGNFGSLSPDGGVGERELPPPPAYAR